jgi:ribonuclease HI
MAYVNPLVYLSAHRTTLQPKQVHIVSDAAYMVRVAKYRSHANHQELWQIFQSFERRGLILNWHWIPRNCLGFNKMADNLANRIRKAGLTVAEALPRLTARYLQPKPPLSAGEGADALHNSDPATETGTAPLTE